MARSGGPVPKRLAERAGHRAKADRPDQVKMYGRVRPPGAARDWCPEAKRWYRALTRSGQAVYFEPSDWEFARIVARLLTDELAKGQPLLDEDGKFVIDEGRPVMNGRRSSEMVKAILAAMDSLLTTEGARRRMRVEIERDKKPDGTKDAKVAVLEEYRSTAAT